MKVRNMFTFDPQSDVVGEVNTLPSLTIPDEVMSMREILIRHSRGLPIAAGKVPIYEGDDSDLPDPRTMDLADRQLLKESLQAELRELDARKAERDKARQKAQDEHLKRAKEREDRITEMLEEKLNNRKNNQNV